MRPNDLPPWPAVHQQMQRWIKARCFEALAHDLREVLRVGAGRAEQPTAVIIDSRTVQSTPTSGERAGYDGAKRRKGAKVRAVVDTLGHLLALRVTSANEQGRAQVGALAAEVQAVTADHAKRGFVLLPRRWVVERSFGWAARFRRLARDYERLASSLAGLHWLAFVCIMLRHFLSSGS